MISINYKVMTKSTSSIFKADIRPDRWTFLGKETVKLEDRDLCHILTKSNANILPHTGQ